jgi:hypothetical protein
MVRTYGVFGLLVVVLAQPAFGQSSSALRQPLVGKTPPELVAGAMDWLGGPPVSLQKLQGKVVWLQFNF